MNSNRTRDVPNSNRTRDLPDKKKPNPLQIADFEALEKPMLECYQFKDMNMLEHGLDVHNWYCDLYRILLGLPPQRKWKLSSWIYNVNIRDILCFDIIKLYQIYHDCGKPFCSTIDEQGKWHFPNHAETSKQRWLDCSNGSAAAKTIAELIGMDMDVHMGNLDITNPYAVSLLLTGLCEIHSNAQMFGGIESDGFKIKWKKIDKVGRSMFCQFQ